MLDEIYRGPDWRPTPTKIRVPVGEYTVADQARGWGVPEQQLKPEEHVIDVASETVKPVE